jgi:subtilisin family serine protease
MKYIVLRDLQRTRQFDPLVPYRRTFDHMHNRTDFVVPPAPRIDVETTDARGRNELARDPEVVALTAVMPTFLIEPFESTWPDDGIDSWGIAAVGAARSQYSGSDTVAAVLDTGIDSSHAAFAAMTLVEEDFSGNGNGDRHGHGTHCAGTIFGRDVDGCRFGVARGVRRALIGKVLTDAGKGSSDMVFRGLQWAVDQGAHVISISLGFDFPGMVRQRVAAGWPPDLATSIALEAYRGNIRMFDALMAMIRAQEAFRPGCVVVAAAGNESKRDLSPDYEIAASLPAAAEGVLSIGAVGRSPGGYALAPFSNSYPKLCAPGIDIKSARAGGGVRAMSGTSMACPHVAGVAALWWEAIREAKLPATAPVVIARMLATCRVDNLPAHLGVAERGSGLIVAP